MKQYMRWHIPYHMACIHSIKLQKNIRRKKSGHSATPYVQRIYGHWM